MHRLALGVVLVHVCIAGSALAQTLPSWKGELRADVPLTWSSTNQGNRSSTTPVRVDPRLSAVYYAQPLENDPAHALGLLGFLQHPDTVTVQGGGVNTPGGGLSATVFPVRATGFTASVSLGSSGGGGSLDLAYSAGIQHYLRHDLRLDVTYTGNQSRSEHPVAVAGAIGASATSQRSDRGRIGITGLTPGESVSMGGAIEAGYARIETRGPGSFTSSAGPFYALTGSATWYAARALQFTLGGGFRGQTRASDGETDTDTVTLLGSAAVQLWLTDDASLRAAYELDHLERSNDTDPTAFTRASAATLTLSLRL